MTRLIELRQGGSLLVCTEKYPEEFDGGIIAGDIVGFGNADYGDGPEFLLVIFKGAHIIAVLRSPSRMISGFAEMKFS